MAPKDKYKTNWNPHRAKVKAAQDRKKNKGRGWGKGYRIPPETWDAIEIDWKTSPESIRKLGERYGVSESTIRERARRYLWGERAKTAPQTVKGQHAKELQLAKGVLEGKSRKEIGDSLGISANRVSSIVSDPDSLAHRAIYLHNRKLAALVNLTSEQILLEEMAIAFADPAAFYDKNGKLLKPHELTPEARAAVKKFKTRTITTQTPNGEEVRKEIAGYETWEKGKSLDRLHKFMGHYQPEAQGGSGGGDTNIFAVVMQQLSSDPNIKRCQQPEPEPIDVEPDAPNS